MLIRLAVSVALICASLPCASAKQSVTLTASDSVRVYGDFYPADNASHNYILLFHQAGSNRA
ncbi:MAG: hypothetical protein KGN84_07875, partial [Acidobacteriota bacterium]|nr:hypothetical protein [Acidobacteriota bacterium]